MDDQEWLASRTGVCLLGGHHFVASKRHRAGLVVEPSRVAALHREAKRSALPLITVVGWPDGRHHSVVKAAEARLAVDSGAQEIWLAVDADADDENVGNAVLSDVIAVRQAVEAPARFGLLYDGRSSVVAAGERIGADTLVLDVGTPHPTTTLELAVFGVADSLDCVVDCMSQGASRVFTRPELIR